MWDKKGIILIDIERCHRSLNMSAFFRINRLFVSSITDSAKSSLLVNFWSKYFRSSLISGWYGGTNYLLSSNEISMPLKKGWERTSYISLRAPSLFFLFLSSNFFIKSFAKGETSIPCFCGSGKLTWLSFIKKYIRCLFLWKNGGTPTSISYNKMPSAHQSTVWSCPLPMIISGERYSAVPQKELASSVFEAIFASPKSARKR